MRGDSLQTFETISSPSREILSKEFDCVPQKLQEAPVNDYKKTQIATTSFQSIEPTQKVIEFLDKLQTLSKNAYGVAARAFFEQFFYAKIPPHLVKSMNQAHSVYVTKNKLCHTLNRN